MGLSTSEIANQVIAGMVLAALLAIAGYLIKRFSRIELSWATVSLLFGQALLVVLVGLSFFLNYVNRQADPPSTREVLAEWIKMSPVNFSPLDTRRTTGLSFEYAGNLAREFEDVAGISLFVYGYPNHPDGLVAIEAVPPLSSGCVPRSKEKAIGLLAQLGILPEDTDIRMTGAEGNNLRFVRWIDVDPKKSPTYFVDELAELAGVANLVRYALVGQLSEC